MNVPASIEFEALELDAAEWEYLAEGNNHIILQYNGRPDSVNYRKVLRMSKMKVAPDVAAQHFYMIRAVLPILSDRYVERPTYVQYCATFASEISQKIEPLRPLARRMKQLTPSAGIAQIESNLCFVPSPPRAERVLEQHDSFPTACVEIKVKSGLCSVSPWSFDYDSVRRRLNRFSLIQLYKQSQSREGIHTAWGGDVRTVSEYSPADLCSGDALSVRRACSALLQSPQNNFIVSLSGKKIFGLHQVDVDPLKKACGQLFGVEDETCLLDVISEILAEEDVLQRLQVLQAADVVDVEGAATVMSRLVALSGGVDAAVEAVNSWENGEELVLVDLARVAETRLTVSRERRDDLMRGWGGMRCHQEAVPCASGGAAMRLTNELLDLTASATAERGKSDVVDWMNSLPAADCICLLRLWLIALGASDVSVIISFRERDETVSAQESAIASLPSASGTTLHDNGRRGVVLEKQTNESPGIIKHSAVEGAPSVLFSYRVTAIDLGPKPAGKILNKCAEEKAICETAISEE